MRFLDDGRIEIDSNTVERSMRPIALNRKNALLACSDEGAENWAMLASLVETCKLHGANPEAYLSDVLTKLVNQAARRTDVTPELRKLVNRCDNGQDRTGRLGPRARRLPCERANCS